jgi:AraC-like DNA-binding protein
MFLAEPEATAYEHEGSMKVDGAGPEGLSSLFEAVAACHVRVGRPQEFQAVVDARSFAELEFIDVRCDHHSTSRSRSHVEADGPNTFYFMILTLAGWLRLSQDGRETVLVSGAVGFFDSMRPAAVETSDGYRGLTLKIPYRLLSYPPERLAGLTARRFEGEEGGVAAVCAMLIALHERVDIIDISSQFKMVRVVVDLVESLLASADPSRTGADQRQEIGLEDVQRYIERHLGDPDLCPKEIATAHFMSVRRLHYLFEETGTTLSVWIRARRVARCKEDLANRGLLSLPIAVVARKWGFRTTSHFGQVFKTCTGLTPREFRNRYIGTTSQALGSVVVELPRSRTTPGPTTSGGRPDRLVHVVDDRQPPFDNQAISGPLRPRELRVHADDSG